MSNEQRMDHAIAARAFTNAETVRDIYAAFLRGDVPSILAKLREDVEWEVGYEHNSDIPWLKTGRGHAHVGHFFATLQGFQFDRFEVIDVIAGGDRVVGIAAIDATWKATGGRIVEPGELHLWQFDDAGRVKSMRHVADTRQHARALEART